MDYDRIPIDPMSSPIVALIRPYISKWSYLRQNVLGTLRNSFSASSRNRRDSAAVGRPPYRSDMNDKLHPNTIAENDCAVTERAPGCGSILRTDLALCSFGLDERAATYADTLGCPCISHAHVDVRPKSIHSSHCN